MKIASVIAAAALVLGFVGAQESRAWDRSAAVVAMDHLETKGITAWILDASGPAHGRSLLVARLGTAMTTRLVGVAMRDVMLDPSGRHALLVVERDGGLAVDRLAIEGVEPPRTVLASVGGEAPVMHRAGADVVILTADALVAVGAEGATRTLLRKDDPGVADVAMNGAQTMVASVRRGGLALAGADGAVLGVLGQGRSPAFVEGGELAFAVDEPEGKNGARASIFLIDTAIADTDAVRVMLLDGGVSRLRAAGEGCLLFRHRESTGAASDWLLHLATGVVRPMRPRDYGALASLPAPPRLSNDAGVIAGEALPEPETPASGFFAIGEQGVEFRSAYEENGFDDVRHPLEAQIYRALLDRFLAGVQWPFRRAGAYEPFIAPDDQPFRPHSRVPHRGLDLGARLVHTSTRSVAFHAPGTYVYPLHRGGRLLRNRAVVVRGEGGAAVQRLFPLLQEVELREAGFVLRIHVAYEHAGGGADLAESGDAVAIDGDQPIGALEPFSAVDPSGGWAASDPALRAAGIAKGNHVHVGIGGVYRSFNGTPAEGAAKLRWYRERLIPALQRSQGPR